MNKIINPTNGIFIFIVVCFAVLFFMKNNSAPGCNQIPGIAGGCFSRFVIINEKTEPRIPCLKFSKNNCNWPDLSVSNFCEEPVYINGTKIPPESHGTNNSYLILDTGGDNSSYQGEQIPPLKNKKFFVDGKIGEKEFKISFTVTKNQCD